MVENVCCINMILIIFHNNLIECNRLSSYYHFFLKLAQNSQMAQFERNLGIYLKVVLILVVFHLLCTSSGPCASAVAGCLSRYVENSKKSKTSSKNQDLNLYVQAKKKSILPGFILVLFNRNL